MEAENRQNDNSEVKNGEAGNGEAKNWEAEAIDSGLLTVQEAAHLKGVTRSAIYAAIKQGRLAHRKVLGRLALKRADVLAWTPSPSQGRRQGSSLSSETRAKIAASQRQSWAKRQGKPG